MVTPHTINAIDPSALLAALVASSDDAILAKSLDGVILAWNAAAERLYGYSAAEAIGQHIGIIVPPERADELAAVVSQVARGEQVAHLETERRHKDGERIAVSVTISPIRDQDGRIVAASAIARDIRARQAADAARLGALLEAAPDAMIIADAAGRIMLLNAQAERLFGYGRGELLGQRIEMLVPERFHAAHLDHRTAYNRSPSVRQMGTGLELYGRRSDGSEVPVEVSLSPVSIDGTTWVISAIRNVSARLATESALREVAAVADAANAAKSEFLSRMSHELRTPLNAVLGFAQLLELDPLLPRQQQNVERILTAGRHLLSLINEVLDITRIESGRLTLSLEPIRVRDVVHEAFDLVRPQAAREQISLDSSALDEIAPEQLVQADRQRLQQVLLNLLSNAIKYNRAEGSVTLRCSVSGECLRLGVEDTGRGIPADRLARVFVPFDRLGAEETGVEGTGLGLALSQGLVAAMNGTLTVQSSEGVGSTFWVTLPLAEPSAARAISESIAAQPPDAPSTRQRRVLYVEDNLPNLELMEQVIARRPDLTLMTATAGQAGLEAAMAERPDLILLDLHLPDFDGSTVLHRLHSLEETRAIPVVVVSADATQMQRERLLEAGASAYLTKPFDVRRLLALLSEMLPSETL
jgi:protein-histidine pros-kinase